MLQDQSRNRTPMPAAQPPAGATPPEPGPARAEAGIARMLSAPVEEVNPDAAFLALAPTLLPMLDEFDRLWAAASDIHKRSLSALGGAPDFAVVGRAAADDWDKRLHASDDWSRYLAARKPADALDERIETMIAEHMEVPARTLEGLLLKRRIGRTFDQYKECATDDLDRLLSTVAGLASFPARPAIVEEAERPLDVARTLSPDGDLTIVTLGAQFDVAARHETTAVYAEDEVAASAATDRTAALARRLIAEPAVTLEGVRAKLRVAAFYGACDPDLEHTDDSIGDAAIRSLYRDVPGIEISTDPADIRIVEVLPPAALPESGCSTSVLDAIKAHENAWQAYEVALAASAAVSEASDQSDQAWRDLFKARPQSLHDLWMLLTHIEQHHKEHHKEHHGMEETSDIWGTLTGAVAALRTVSKAPAAPQHDLSKLSVLHLSRLYEICRQQREILSPIEDSWVCEERDGSGYNALGNLIEAEGGRFAFLSDDAVAELERRQPADEVERNFILEIRARHHLAGNGYIEPELVAEIVAAWGAK